MLRNKINQIYSMTVNKVLLKLLVKFINIMILLSQTIMRFMQLIELIM